MPEAKPVSLRVARASKVIGMSLTQAQCCDALTRLGLSLTEGSGIITVTPPSYRFDLQIEEDLIEEVARMVGYNNLPQTPPLAPITAKIRPESQRSPFGLRRSIAALGYQETINFSFCEARWEHELAGNPDPIRVLNPIASPLSVMRSGLIGSLVNTLRYNLARKAPRVRLFEIGRVFRRDASAVDGPLGVAGVSQPMHLAGLAYGPVDASQWGTKDRIVDFFDVKGDVQALFSPRAVTFAPGEHPALHPGRSARLEIDGEVVGHIGELHPRWRQAYELPGAPVVFELALSALLRGSVPAFAPWANRVRRWRSAAPPARRGCC